MSVDHLKVKIFADGANEAEMVEMAKKAHIKGLTTNPTLMRKSGITDYEKFARGVLNVIKHKPISFEVFSDDLEDMRRQALTIASWGDNVYVKIPVTNTKGESCAALIHELAKAGVKQNVTALMTLAQVQEISDALGNFVPCNISVFAGRIADTGRDPLPIMRDAVALMATHPKQELIWASPRELLNVFQADEIGCHIITITPDILKKLNLYGKDLDQYSLETVKMFYEDAQAAGFNIEE